LKELCENKLIWRKLWKRTFGFSTLQINYDKDPQKQAEHVATDFAQNWKAYYRYCLKICCFLCKRLSALQGEESTRDWLGVELCEDCFKANFLQPQVATCMYPVTPEELQQMRFFQKPTKWGARRFYWVEDLEDCVNRTEIKLLDTLPLTPRQLQRKQSLDAALEHQGITQLLDEHALQPSQLYYQYILGVCKKPLEKILEHERQAVSKKLALAPFRRILGRMTYTETRARTWRRGAASPC
jgi:hypothetical protein